MPALLKIAKGAVIRAGYNTTWECVSAGTPFIPLVGTTYVEPVQKRVNNLAALGLIPPDPESFWFDREWRANQRQIAAGIASRYPGTPHPQGLARLILNRPDVGPAPQAPSRAAGKRAGKQGIPLVIRVDDAICQEPAFVWSLEVLAARGLRASLEVVPYLLEFDEKLLDSLDPAKALFQVSQHGYAHVPRLSQDGRRCEFLPENAPSPEELEVIARGRHRLEVAFPSRFAGGFSPPFDVLPNWLPPAWQRLGGRFVYCLFQDSAPGGPVPVTRAGVDIWNWAIDSALSRQQILRKLAVQFILEGHTGIVLHPRCLRRREDQSTLLSLLDYLEQGTVTVNLSDLALGNVEIAKTSDRGALLRTAFGTERTGITL